ncbi:MAG TPA: hypothetical protein PKO33_03090 [Pyrinomonadaceae bacterium]|nr:hypothetical protein [Pyrinomonadaceae bacterium]
MSKRSIITARGRMLAGEGAPPGWRRPFWLPASNYYFLAIGVAVALFFVIWGILHDGQESMPWIPAGIISGIIIFGAVFLREIILRRYQRRYLIDQQKLDRNLRAVRATSPGTRSVAKLSIERNAELVRRIKKKSAAAKTLMRLAEGHFEVFEFCSEYLALAEEQMKSVGTGSPRLAAIRKGRETAETIRKEHLLLWAEIEAKRFTKDAIGRVTISERIETAQKASDVLETALEYYPDEATLVNSKLAVAQVIGSMRVGHWIEQAERAQFKGNYRRAVSLYKDALFFLARDGDQVPDAETVAARINSEIEKINTLPLTSNMEQTSTPDD